MKKKIAIFDTTLRDGEQCAGITLSVEDKLKIARKLARLGVDVIEAGFPISSPGDFESVKTIAAQVKGAVICGLARCLKKDIDTCWEAVKFAEKPRIHVFLATSEIHRKYKLRKAKEEILKMAVESVKYAHSLSPSVEFSPEDASRTEPEFLREVVEKVIEAGAEVVNIPDTVGYAYPEEFGKLIGYLKKNVSNIERAIISVHCHNDLGLATANTLSAIKNGAGQVEVTINGIGERAGNAALEEVVMVLHTRKDLFSYQTSIDTRMIYPVSRLVSKLMGMPVQRNKAIVGANAFAHSSGIHLDGILKDRRTYEIIKPEDIGLEGHTMILTARSGRHALKVRLKQLGYELGEEDFEKCYEMFKEIADKKKEVFDEDLIALVEDEVIHIPETYHLLYTHMVSGNRTIPTATVRLRKDKKTYQEASVGNGPVDAAYKAIDRITRLKPRLVDYALRSVTSGKEAMGEVTVKIKEGDVEVIGRGVSTDVLEASVRAYINAINRLIYRKTKSRKKVVSTHL
ncbi:2-isopropylmalate synthase [Candidatus Calescamantes bacterium]|nr:2-isopropylmalate synthase [Candidatus Calescamantes bacterium]